MAHVNLAREYLSVVEHVMGPQTGITAVSFEVDHDRAAKTAEIMAAVDSVDQGDGVILVLDLVGSSPANLARLACKEFGGTIIHGANMPMLLTLAQSRHLPVAKAVARAENSGRKHISSCTVTPTPCPEPHD